MKRTDKELVMLEFLEKVANHCGMYDCTQETPCPWVPCMAKRALEKVREMDNAEVRR